MNREEEYSRMRRERQREHMRGVFERREHDRQRDGPLNRRIPRPRSPPTVSQDLTPRALMVNAYTQRMEPRTVEEIEEGLNNRGDNFSYQRYLEYHGFPPDRSNINWPNPDFNPHVARWAAQQYANLIPFANLWDDESLRLLQIQPVPELELFRDFLMERSNIPYIGAPEDMDLIAEQNRIQPPYLRFINDPARFREDDTQLFLNNANAMSSGRGQRELRQLAETNRHMMQQGGLRSTIMNDLDYQYYSDDPSNETLSDTDL